MGISIEKMYGSYSDADLNDWERFPMNANVLTSSAFGAWLLRRDERRDKAFPQSDYEEQIKINNKLVNENKQLSASITMMKADYNARLKADMAAMLKELQLEIDELPTNRMAITDSSGFICYGYSYDEPSAKDASNLIQQKIDALKGEQE